MTLSSCNRESDEMNSSDMPSEKYSLAGSPVEFISGRTAIDFSGMFTTTRVGLRKANMKAPTTAATMSNAMAAAAQRRFFCT